jgi:uncharacterized protein (TIGR02145 family)
MTVTANVFGGAATYQWQSSANGNDWSNVSTGGNSNAYNAPTAMANLGITFYRCRVTTACGEVVFPKWKITVVDCSGAPTIFSLATDETKITKTGEAVSDLSVTADGKGASVVNFQWQSSDTGAPSDWDNIDDETNDTYTAPVTEAGTTYYRCVVSTGCGSATSNVFTVNVCGTFVEDSEKNWYCTGNFGDAGTWMTMNLRSTTGLTANANSGNSNLAYYYYPNKDENILTSHPEYGLFYTWAAANTPTSATESSNQFVGKASDRQGICPSDWHLPSDYEWNQLTDVISASADGAYSTTTGTGNVGTKMKSRTAVTTQADGTSNGLAANGFDALLVGNMGNGSASNSGTYTVFWSSSSNYSSSAWCWYLYDSYTGVDRNNYSKYYMYSVRCKKD